MAAAVTNPLKLLWGSFVCGDTSERLIVGIHSLRDAFDSGGVTLDILVRGATDAAFAAACVEMQSEFSKRRQRILLTQGGSTLLDLNPTGNTGLNTFAEIAKPGTPGADTGRSRLYTVTLGGGKPASDTNGRRDVVMSITYDGARRVTVTFRGTWTAYSTTGALAQYQAQITTYCSSALSAVFPAYTFELVPSETLDRDDQDDLVSFQRVHRQIILPQPSGAPDHASIVDPSVVFRLARDFSGDSGGGSVRRLDQVEAHFECDVDLTVTQDLEALWVGTILPWIKSTFSSQWGATRWACPNDSHGLLPFSNRLVGDVSFLAVIGATDVIASLSTAEYEGQTGKAFTGEWDGDPDSYHVDQGKRLRLRKGLRVVRVLGSVKPKERFDEGGGALFGVAFSRGFSSTDVTHLVDIEPSRPGRQPVPAGGHVSAQESDGAVFPGGGIPSGGGSAWHRVAYFSRAVPRTIGKPGEEQIDVTDLEEWTQERYASSPGGGGGGTVGVIQ